MAYFLWGLHGETFLKIKIGAEVVSVPGFIVEKANGDPQKMTQLDSFIKELIHAGKSKAIAEIMVKQRSVPGFDEFEKLLKGFRKKS
jgi:hypothetical protein